MIDMVKNVARVLYNRMSLLGGTFDEAGERAQEHYLSLARAAIEAMREPSEAMLKDGSHELEGDVFAVRLSDALDCYRAMIAAALGPSK